jgi:hypothetical protein
VIEPQHGFIDDWHYAYTYPPACITEPDHPCRTLLPDVLLTFGEHWSNVAQTPSEKVVIGYPYLTQMVEQTTSSIQQNDKQILVLSGHIVADRTIALVGQLSQALPDHTVVVKLHPLEVADRPRYQTRLDRPNIRVIGQADVFPLVAGSAVIVSLYATTVMVEAAAFPGKRIFCQEAHLLPAGISVPFDDGAHLVKLINTPDASMLKVDPGQFWTVGWKHNLETFLKSQNLYL